LIVQYNKKWKLEHNESILLDPIKNNIEEQPQQNGKVSVTTTISSNSTEHCVSEGN